MSSRQALQITVVGKPVIISLQVQVIIGKLMNPGSQSNILGAHIMLIFPIIPHMLCQGPVKWHKICHHPKLSTKMFLIYGAIIPLTRVLRVVHLLSKTICPLIKAAYSLIKAMLLHSKEMLNFHKEMLSFHRAMRICHRATHGSCKGMHPHSKEMLIFQEGSAQLPQRSVHFPQGNAQVP